MSYNPYSSSTPPRPFRIMLGAMMVIGGLIAGMTGAVHEFHKSSVMQGEPVEMDWETLVNEGYGENPHIRLVNVQVLEPYEQMEKFFEDEFFEDDDTQDSSVGPTKIIPIGGDESECGDRVTVARGVHFVDEAFRQVDATGDITGMVSTYSVDQMISDFLGFVTGERLEGPDDDGGDISYTIVPIDGIPDLPFARNLFLASGFALALGLILCGSGGPGIWCCWYAPLPSVLSLIGYPMRYGRGTWTTRIAYIAIGAFLMGYGYFLLVPMGSFGAADGNPIFHALGFAAMFIGLGGVLSVPMQITTRALSASVEVQPKKKPVRLSWKQACSMEPVLTEIEYEDDKLVPAGTLPLSGELREKAESLQADGFNQAEALQWQRELGVAAAAAQIGCRKMVVSDMEYNHELDIVETGLISVLATGMPIITVSANSSVQQDCPSPKCLFQRSESSDPTEMLAGHLEIVVGEAESRDSVVVEFDPNETNEIVQYARRVLAEIRGTIDGQIVNVGPKRYGRFHFPPAPVPDFVRGTF